jgi:hypothetical protein
MGRFPFTLAGPASRRVRHGVVFLSSWPARGRLDGSLAGPSLGRLGFGRGGLLGWDGGLGAFRPHHRVGVGLRVRADSMMSFEAHWDFSPVEWSAREGQARLRVDGHVVPAVSPVEGDGVR